MNNVFGQPGKVPSPTATYDPVTGVLDRAPLRACIESELDRTDAPAAGAVIAAGVDNLRALNASYGWTAGTEVLRSVAARLWGSVDESATVARVSGDVFAIVLPDADPGAAEGIAARLLDQIRGLRTDADGTRIRVSISAGVAPLRGFDRTWEGVINEADLALSLAKEGGRDRLRTYTPHVRRELAARNQWAAEIRAALENDGLRLLRQPVRPAIGAEPEQHELLVRLHQSSGELIPPAEFLPVAERFGLMQRIDRWVVERAVEILAGPRAPRALEINVSARSVADPGFLHLVRHCVTAAGVEPSRLIFEINEPDSSHDFEQLRGFVVQLREIGCRFALDNFGVGYASLALLKELPLDFVKIDGRFIRHLTSDAANRALVRAIAGLAHELGMRTVATFVSDDETAALARELGVDLLQGFHVGLPQS